MICALVQVCEPHQDREDSRDSRLFASRISEVAAKVGGEEPSFFLPHKDILIDFLQYCQVVILHIITTYKLIIRLSVCIGKWRNGHGQVPKRDQSA